MTDRDILLNKLKESISTLSDEETEQVTDYVSSLTENQKSEDKKQS